MGAIVSAIENFLTNTLGAHFGVILCSMIPIIELRGGIPLGMALGLPWWQSFLFAVVGNMLPVPFILLFIRKILAWMQVCRVKLFNKVSSWVVDKGARASAKISKCEFFGLLLFVAIPLPGTGAWTGALGAALLNMRMRRALPSIFLGVLIAGLIMTLASYGVVGALSFLN